MPFWKSVQEGAQKAAFEAEKLVRIRREEGALADLRGKMSTKTAELGQVALSLYRSGTLSDPSVATLAEEIAGLEAQAQQQQEKIEAVKAEQFQTGEPAPAVAQPAPVPPAVATVAAEQTMPAPLPEGVPAAVEEPASIQCPNCNTTVRSSVTFCPECGTRLK